MKFEPHWGALPRPQRRIWSVLEAASGLLRKQGFYLAGGTGLALQLGHRQSVDFDFFSRRSNTSQAVRSHFEEMSGFVLRDVDRNTLHAQLRGVKISFIGAYRYRMGSAPLTAGHIHIAGIRDIAAMKLLALTHRAALRDYLDLAAIIKSGLSMSELLRAAGRKYGGRLNVMVSLRALTSFDDIEPDEPVILDRELRRNWKAILRAAVLEATA